MAYAEVEDIQAEFKSIKFDEDDSAVVVENVESFLAQADAEIDARISISYQVPVTGGDSALLLLKQICTWLVSQRVKDIVEVKNVRTETDQDVKIDTAARARKMLDQIADGTLPLIGATPASSAGGVKSYVSANNIPRVFKKDSEQW